MSHPIEARSLAALNNLAANPPQYPRNPTHEALQPLVLYIVRVPGSQDVVLTPLKPPTKASISADAILSSLYYLHVSTPRDGEVQVPTGKTDVERQCEQKLSGPSLRRKPLPSEVNVTKAVVGQQPPLMMNSHEGHHQNIAGQKRSDPIGSPDPAEQIAANTHQIPGTEDPQLPAARKPLGPRPLLQTVSSPGSAIPRKPVSEAQHSRGGVSSGAISESLGQHGSDRTNMDLHGTLSHLSAAMSSPSEEAAVKPSLGALEALDSNQRVSKVMNIAIIRRDPSSASQWNVGNIFSKVNDGSFFAEDIKIEIETPGYQRFGRTGSYKSEDLKTELASLLNRRQDPDRSNSPNTSNLVAKFAEEARSPPQSDGTIPTMFTRFVSLKDARSRSPKKHGRTRARASSNPLRVLDPNAGAPAPSKAAQLRHASISFLSPWNGMCNFSTGIDGRSLKCRHSLPSGSLENGPASAIAAELRFNLPWKTTLAQKKDDLMMLRGGGQAHVDSDTHRPSLGAIFDKKGEGKSSTSFRNSLQWLKELSLNRDPTEHIDSSQSPQFRVRGARSGSEGQSWPSTQPEEELDLSLGREKAGGGLRGQSAKLGKLIIEDEGLKMCDLVVASCMAVWWMYYQTS